MLNYEMQKLSNGLRTVFVPMAQTNAVTILILINTGSRNEDRKTNGISHFLEHLFFKGTPTRPTAMQISYELDSIGATYNAFTAEEYTGFYICCAKSKFDIAIDILSDMIINSNFEDPEIEKERGVIIEEINMYEDLPQKQIIDITKEHFYGDTPLGRSTLGPKKNILRFNHNDFKKYKSNHYIASNSILSIAGGGDIKTWKRIAEEKFSLLPTGKNENPIPVKNLKNTKSVRLKYKKTDQAHITLGFNTFCRTDKRRYELKIINNILGETMSSRLFTEVREKRGLAYYVGSDDWYFKDAGALVAYAGVDKKRINEAIEVIYEQLKLIGKKSITEKEVQKAKDNTEGRMYLGLEESFAVAEFFAEQELLYNEILQPEEIMKSIKEKSLFEVNALAQKLINDNIKLTIIGPYKSTKQFLNY